MPAKGGKKPNPKQDAAKAAQEKQRLEEERKRQEEEEERKARELEERIHREVAEEVARRTAEQQRQRLEEEARRAREDEERREREREREVQQLQLFEEKDKEILELTEKVFTMNRNYLAQQNDLQQAIEHAAQLAEELEATQLRAVEYEAQVDRQEVEFGQREVALNEHIAGLRAQLATAEATIASLQQDMTARSQEMSAEIARLKEQLMQSMQARQQDEEQHTGLLRMLNADLERTRAALQQTEAALEKKEREDVRNTIMLGLLNSQVDGGRDDNTKLMESVAELRLQVSALQASLGAAQERLAHYEDETESLNQAHSREVRQLRQELQETREQLAEEAAGRVAATTQGAETRDAFAAYQRDAERREKEAFQQIVLLRSELEHRQELITQYEDEAERREKEHYEKVTGLTFEQDQLKIRLQQLQEQLSQEQEEAFKTSSMLRAEIESVTQRKAAVEERLHQAETEHATRELEMKAELHTMQGKLELERTTAAQRAQEAFEQLTRLTTELQTLQEENARKAAMLERRDKDYMEASIALNTEKEVLKAEAVRLGQEVEKAQQQMQEVLQTKIIAVEQLRREKDEVTRVFENKLGLAGDMQRLLHQQKEDLAREVARLTEEHAKKDSDNYDRSTAYKQQIAALKREVETQRALVEQLEGSIAESYNFKLLAEQNDMLLEEVESYKAQIKNLNNALSTLKIESEILEGHHTKALQEQNEAYALRIRELEREHRALAPLMQEMVATLQKHGLSGTLSRDVGDLQSTAIMQTTIASTRPATFGTSGFAATDIHSPQARMWSPEALSSSGRKLAPLPSAGLRKAPADVPFVAR